MRHDLAAEIAGYRDELRSAQQRGNTEREAAVREEITRVGGDLATHARQRHIEADRHDTNGQPVLAALARQRAAQLAAAIPSGELANPGGEPAGENTDDTSPKHTAVTRRGRIKES